MPGPIIKAPKEFIGSNIMPEGLNKVLEFFFGEPDTVPMGPEALAVAKVPSKLGMELLKRIRTLPTLSGFSPDTVTALTRLQQKYPRTFAHMRGVESADFPASRLGVAESYERNPMTKVYLNRTLEGDDSFSTAAHELTHVAQQLRNPRNAVDVYEYFNKTYGYTKNPHEVRAREAGDNFLKYIRSGKP